MLYDLNKWRSREGKTIAEHNIIPVHESKYVTTHKHSKCWWIYTSNKYKLYILDDDLRCIVITLVIYWADL